MNAATVEAELLRLKDAALAATRDRDAEFYRNYLSDDAIAVVPGGVFDKQQIVEFRSTRIDDTHATVLSPDVGMVTYRATLARGAQISDAFVTTIYRRVAAEWKGVVYQQTPLLPR